ncbi:hypothetical protein NC652_010234 [Populus alba x Populus x berolinensis]|uniref:Uncharacterized protein n=1 Tax=Populus alba x Populus x berolinensis TaxID=444605 RepID=A0AAD6R0X7_9ROSI|nr:hypothetical protein NC652_010234 [Populus alba x Populus x berolinensis]KAJ6999517.1 hypothetical protein NC653_010277 [Populus alba x Populus x berolinensis]
MDKMESRAPRLASWIELKILLRLAAPAVLVYLINNPCPCPPESSLATSAILSLLLPLLAMWCPILSLWPHVREGKCCGNSVVNLMELADMRCSANIFKDQFYVFAKPI